VNPTPELIERARTYVNGRCTAKMFSTFHPETKTFTDWWIGRVNGRNVSFKKDYHSATKEEALADARAFRDHCRKIVAQAEA